MSLTTEQINKFNEHMNSKRINPSCNACGQKQWTLGDIISSPIFSGGGISIGGPSIPMVQLICQNCYHVMLFAAAPLELLKQ